MSAITGDLRSLTGQLSRTQTAMDTALLTGLNKALDYGCSCVDLIAALAPATPATTTDPSHLGTVAIDARAVAAALADAVEAVELNAAEDDALPTTLALTTAVRHAAEALATLLPRSGGAAISVGGTGKQLSMALGS